MSDQANCLFWWDEQHQMREMDVIHLDISKAFNAVPESTVVEALLERWTVRWVEALPDCHTKGCDRQGKPNQQQITSSIAQELLLELMLLDVFAGDLDDEIEQTLGQSLDDAGLAAVVSTWRMVAQELQQVLVVGWQGPPGFGEGKCKALLWGQSHAIHSPGWVLTD